MGGCVECGEPVMVGPSGPSLYCSTRCKHRAKNRRRKAAA